MFNNLIRQGTGMQGQFFVGGKKLTLLLFQQTFRRKTRAPLLGQLFGQIHSVTTTRNAVLAGSSSRNIGETK